MGTNLENRKQSFLAKALGQPVTFWSPINSFLGTGEAWGMALHHYFKTPLASVIYYFFLQKPTRLVIIINEKQGQEETDLAIF